MSRITYVDYNATTPVAPEVMEAMQPFFCEHFANPSSLHQLGRTPARALKEARRSAAKLLGAALEEEIIFTSGGTESNNAAIRSAAFLSRGRKRILSSPVEHSSVLRVLQQLEKEGFAIDYLSVDRDGLFCLDEFKSKISPETALVSLMMANNETGVFFPIEEAARLAKEQGAFVHVDGVQVVGKAPLVLKDTAIDFFSASAHKFYGPKGAGALYLKKGTPFQSHILGGSQERARRAGTENVAGIVGLGQASEMMYRILTQEAARLCGLRDTFETAVLDQIPGTTVTGAASERLPNTSNIQFEGVEAETLLMALDQQGICASSGSACMSGANEPSHVLKAMGFSDEEARSAVRFSFGLQTTAEQIDFLLSTLTGTVKKVSTRVIS